MTIILIITITILIITNIRLQIAINRITWLEKHKVSYNNIREDCILKE